MGKYKEIALTEPKAVAYIREHLGYGHTLSSYFLEKVDLQTGYVTTGLPGNANLEKVYNFKYGGILPTAPESEWRRVIGKDGRKFVMVPTPRFFSYTVEIISSFLKGGAGRICILENATNKPTDPVLQKYQSIIWTHQDEIYHILGREDYSNKEIEKIINEAEALWTFVGFMTYMPSKEFLISSRYEIPLEELKALAERTEKVIVGAYDGEGYLIWHRK